MLKALLKALLISAGITAIFMALINYLMLPAWNFHSADFWWFWLIALLTFSGIFSIASYCEYELGDDEMGALPAVISWGVMGVFVVVFIRG